MQIRLPELMKDTAERESEPWLLSYTDMVTLLLAFFVLFFAISRLDTSKFEMILDYFNRSESMPLYQLEHKFNELVQRHNLQKSVDVQLTPEGLLVNFQDKILFDSGKAELKSGALPVLNALAEILKSAEVQQRKIQVEGHTDTVPVAPNAAYPSNWELSAARAARVIRYLTGQGLRPSRFVAVGYADTRLRRPETPQKKGLQVNRRVSLLIK